MNIIDFKPVLKILTNESLKDFNNKIKTFRGEYKFDFYNFLEVEIEEKPIISRKGGKLLGIRLTSKNNQEILISFDEIKELKIKANTDINIKPIWGNKFPNREIFNKMFDYYVFGEEELQKYSAILPYGTVSIWQKKDGFLYSSSLIQSPSDLGLSCNKTQEKRIAYRELPEAIKNEFKRILETE